MNDIKIIIWLFPILFIFHDFEEIIFIQSWINKNKPYLCNKFPKLSKKLLPHFEKITTSSFALGVGEEFIIISIVTVVAYVSHWYLLWVGLFITFTLHLVIHYFQAMIVRRYIPAITTSIICLPICIYILKRILKWFPLESVVLYSFLAFVLTALNLFIVHKGIKKFGNWLLRYEQQYQ